MVPGSGAEVNQDGKNYLFSFPLKNGEASWYSLAAWDQEGTNDPVPMGSGREPRDYVARIADVDRLTSQHQLVTYVKQFAGRLKTPATVRIISTGAEAQSAPSDTLHPIASRTYKQAIDLLQKEIDRTAAKWAPVISESSPASVGKSAGDGFFTDGDDQTGEWKHQKGLFWTGSF